MSCCAGVEREGRTPNDAIDVSRDVGKLSISREKGSQAIIVAPSCPYLFWCLPPPSSSSLASSLSVLLSPLPLVNAMVMVDLELHKATLKNLAYLVDYWRLGEICGS
ncbi:nicotinamidase 2-like isoform X2 [Cucumis melo var. makuwa]|uniref:Nicotinamidase 2-like isoform X2 n=1 Tax=Cucumis melo var. makuwa TaxID=1194695 RepID=A0A5D3CC49_CUCMM|nr:nicotinamidase 2-like isoform X2 [Cucumis melo var. makuwa]